MKLDGLRNVLELCQKNDPRAAREFIAFFNNVVTIVQVEKSPLAPAVALCFYTLSITGTYSDLKNWIFSHECIDCSNELHEIFIKAVDAVCKVVDQNRDKAQNPELADQLLDSLQTLRA